ncbi:MAG: hypothetical protein HY934_10770, partial [Candidatus Firestonebacteria bacterium]|nr:hypothetical protein [Candidatus Firestonebacteria bacterium]
AAPRMEKGQQRIAINASVSFGKKRKLKWYIPRKWIISNWGYSLEYRYGVGNNTDIGIYPAGLRILPCAIDVRWIDKEEDKRISFHRMELLYNPFTYKPEISNAGLRYDYFTKKNQDDNIISLQGTSLLFFKYWNIQNSQEKYYHPLLGVFFGGESENVLYEIDYLPGFNYFMEKPEAKNPIFNFKAEKENLSDFITGDIFFGISHGNSYTE